VGLACGLTHPIAVAVDAANVFWVDEGDGRVMSIPKTGGPITVLASGQGAPCGIAARGGYLYWRTHGGVVRRKLIPNGALEDLGVAQGDSCAVDADATAAFWFEDVGAGFNLRMAAPPGSSPVTIATATVPFDLDAAGPGEVGWTDGAEGKAYTSPKTSGNAKSQIANGALSGIAFHGPDFFITDPAGGAIHRGQTGFAPQGFTGGLSTPKGIAVFADQVTWVEEGADVVARKGAGEPLAAPAEVLVTGAGACGSIAMDASHVYFATCAGGSVMRVPYTAGIVLE
jgi:hypothetical protein